MSQTLVSVHVVYSNGSTGVQIGTARLAGPRLALMHLPAPTILTDSKPPDLRAGIATTDSDGNLKVEVIDVAQIKVAEQTGYSPVVALRLADDSKLDIHPVAGPSGAQERSVDLAALRQALGSDSTTRREPRTLVPLPDDPQDVGWQCRLFGWDCPPGYHLIADI